MWKILKQHTVPNTVLKSTGYTIFFPNSPIVSLVSFQEKKSFPILLRFAPWRPETASQNEDAEIEDRSSASVVELRGSCEINIVG